MSEESRLKNLKAIGTLIGAKALDLSSKLAAGETDPAKIEEINTLDWLTEALSTMEKGRSFYNYGFSVVSVQFTGNQTHESWLDRNGLKKDNVWVRQLDPAQDEGLAEAKLLIEICMRDAFETVASNHPAEWRPQNLQVITAVDHAAIEGRLKGCAAAMQEFERVACGRITAEKADAIFNMVQSATKPPLPGATPPLLH